MEPVWLKVLPFAPLSADLLVEMATATGYAAPQRMEIATRPDLPLAAFQALYRRSIGAAYALHLLSVATFGPQQVAHVAKVESRSIPLGALLSLHGQHLSDTSAQLILARKGTTGPIAAHLAQLPHLSDPVRAQAATRAGSRRGRSAAGSGVVARGGGQPGPVVQVTLSPQATAHLLTLPLLVALGQRPAGVAAVLTEQMGTEEVAWRTLLRWAPNPTMTVGDLLVALAVILPGPQTTTT